MAVLAGVVLSPLAWANPSGEQVVSGAATFNRAGNTLTINQAGNTAIIHWQDFSVGTGESTQFMLPSSTSATLNRVLSGNPSAILGTLQSNGKLYLINPNGILVGTDANINCGSFIASTLDVANEQFLAGGDLIFKGDSAAKIVNKGKITGINGDVILIAREIRNSGEIKAPNGNVALAAGGEVLVKGSGNERTFVQAGKGNIKNKGFIEGAVAELKAAGGNEYALAVNNSGIVRATGTATIGGKIYLVGNQGTVKNSGQLIAKNADGTGGEVAVQTAVKNGSVANYNNKIENAGLIDVSGTKGGKVTLSGENILLNTGSSIDASGLYGGGEVYVGGGWQGRDASIGNAEAVVLASGAVIDVSAKNSGNGGTAVLWSQNYTAFYGNIFAKGGMSSGNGGSVETSSHHVLQALGYVDASAIAGAAGGWLLDPSNVVIDSTGASGTSYSTSFNPTSDSVILASSIVSSLNAGSNVTITTGSTGSSAGNITVATDIAKTSSSVSTLTLSAANDIYVNAAITNSSGRLNVVLTADSDASGSGSVAFNSSGRVVTYGGNFYAGAMDGSNQNVLVKGQNFTMASGSYIDVSGPNTNSGGMLDIQVNGVVTLAENSLRASTFTSNPNYNNGAYKYYNNYINVRGSSIQTSNANATTPDIISAVDVTLTAGSIGTTNAIKISGSNDLNRLIADPTNSQSSFPNYAKTLTISNSTGNSYVNEITNQIFSTVNIYIGNQANSTQHVDIMNDANGAGTGHITLNTDASGNLVLTAGNIKTGGVAGTYTGTVSTTTDPSVYSTSVRISASGNVTFASNSVDTGASMGYFIYPGSFYKTNYGFGYYSSYAASFYVSGATLTSSEVDGIADIKSYNLTFASSTIGTLANPLEIGAGSILYTYNSGGNTFIKSVDNSYSQINLNNVKNSGEHHILFSGGDHIDYTTDGSSILLPTISGGASDGSNFTATTGVDLSRGNRVFSITARTGNIILYDNSVNLNMGDFTATLESSNNTTGSILAFSDYNAASPVAQITARNASFNNNSSTSGTIGGGGKDIQIARGSDTYSDTLLVYTLQGNVAIHELTANHFKSLDITLNGASIAQNILIDLNGADDVNFSDNGSQVTIDATKVNLSANNRNWRLYTQSRTIQIDGVSLSTGNYNVSSGGGLGILLNSDIITDGGSITLNNGSWNRITLLKSVVIDSNSDNLGSSGSINLFGPVSATANGRTLVVDSNSTNSNGGSIQLYSTLGNTAGSYLTGFSMNSAGSAPSQSGTIYISGSTYYLNGDFTSNGNTYVQTSSLVIDTEQGNTANAGNITFSGYSFNTYSYGTSNFDASTTAAGHNGGNVSLYGTTLNQTLTNTGITVTTTGGAGGTAGNITLPSINTLLNGYTNNQSFTGGIITLHGNLSTNNGSVTLNGDIRLGSSITIDTWSSTNNNQNGTAGSVTITGTGVSALAAGYNLTINTSTDTDVAWYNPPTNTLAFAQNSGAVSVKAGNAGGYYVTDLVINTTVAGTNNTGTKGAITLNTVGTEGSQTYTGGATTLNGTISSNGGNINFSNVSGLTLGSAVTLKTDRAGGTNNAGTINFGSHNLNGAVALTIDVSADGGGSGSNLTLNNVGNLTPLASLTLITSNALSLGNISAGTLSVTSGGAITNTGILTISGTTTLSSGAGNHITLDNAGNNFSTVIVTSGNNVTLVDVNAIDIGESTVSGNLTINAGGAVSNSGSIVVAGTTTLIAGGNTITLDNAGNNFNDVTVTSGAATLIVDADGLGIKGVWNMSGNLLVKAGGAIVTKSGASIVLSGASNATLVSGGDFNNSLGGATLFTVGSGKWLVYTPSSLTAVKGGLIGSEQYSTTYPTAPGFTGNGLIYANTNNVSAGGVTGTPLALPGEQTAEPVAGLTLALIGGRQTLIQEGQSQSTGFEILTLISNEVKTSTDPVTASTGGIGDSSLVTPTSSGTTVTGNTFVPRFGSSQASSQGQSVAGGRNFRETSVSVGSFNMVYKEKTSFDETFRTGGVNGLVPMVYSSTFRGAGNESQPVQVNFVNQ